MPFPARRALPTVAVTSAGVGRLTAGWPIWLALIRRLALIWWLPLIRRLARILANALLSVRIPRRLLAHDAPPLHSFLLAALSQETHYRGSAVHHECELRNRVVSVSVGAIGHLYSRELAISGRALVGSTTRSELNAHGLAAAGKNPNTCTPDARSRLSGARTVALVAARKMALSATNTNVNASPKLGHGPPYTS